MRANLECSSFRKHARTSRAILGNSFSLLLSEKNRYVISFLQVLTRVWTRPCLQCFCFTFRFSKKQCRGHWEYCTGNHIKTKSSLLQGFFNIICGVHCQQWQSITIVNALLYSVGISHAVTRFHRCVAESRRKILKKGRINIKKVSQKRKERGEHSSPCRELPNIIHIKKGNLRWHPFSVPRFVFEIRWNLRPEIRLRFIKSTSTSSHYLIIRSTTNRLMINQKYAKVVDKIGLLIKEFKDQRSSSTHAICASANAATM